VTATEVQKKILAEQFMEVYGAKPEIFAIPVGSLKELKVPGESGRRKHSLITASRLATEKHVDWLVRAVKIARETVPDITLDIYGKGGEEDKIRDLIKELELEDSVRLMGQHDMTDIYQDYEAYYSGSQSEGF
jgi:glycosyltransferase involved in cell wall biosynthesis